MCDDTDPPRGDGEASEPDQSSGDASEDSPEQCGESQEPGAEKPSQDVSKITTGELAKIFAVSDKVKGMTAGMPKGFMADIASMGKLTDLNKQLLSGVDTSMFKFSEAQRKSLADIGKVPSVEMPTFDVPPPIPFEATPQGRQLQVSREAAAHRARQTEILGNMVEQQALQTDVLKTLARHAQGTSRQNWAILFVAVLGIVITLIIGLDVLGAGSNSELAAPAPTPSLRGSP